MNNKGLDIEKRIKRDALKYERFKDQLDQVPQDEIELFRTEVKQAYERIESTGINLMVMGLDPYANLVEMTEDVELKKQRTVTTANNNSLLLPDQLNTNFRHLHDYLHYLYQQPFNFEGEYNVYTAQRYFHSSKIGRKLLYSEVVLQAAYYTYFGKFSDTQKVIIY